jgi:hypothetical protein
MPNASNICVYTVLLGDYEQLNEQAVVTQSQIPFICLTDAPDLRSATWQIVQVPSHFRMDPIRSQRLLKICPHLQGALAPYDRSLYIDNAVILEETPEKIIAHYGWGGGLAVPTHSFRESVMDEFMEVARLGYDDQSRIFEQLNHYLSYGESTLAERPFWAGILLRDHRNATVRKAMDIWASHVLRYARRDQLSFNLAVHEAQLEPMRWEIDTCASWFHSWPHALGRNVVGSVRDPLASVTPPHAHIRQLQRELTEARRAVEKRDAELALVKREADGLGASLSARVHAHAEVVARHAQECERLRSAWTHEHTATRDLLKQCRASLACCQEKLARSEAALAERARHIARLQGEALALQGLLRTATLDAEARLAQVLTSTSWRVTAPLRWLKRLVRCNLLSA